MSTGLSLSRTASRPTRRRARRCATFHDRAEVTMIRVRPMTLADLGLGLRLRQQAGWNQTAADWARFLSLEPEGCFVAEEDGIAAGTVTTCVFGPVAWIGMML